MKEKSSNTKAAVKRNSQNSIQIKLPTSLSLGRHKIQSIKFGTALIDIYALVGVTETHLEGVVRKQQNPEGLGMGFCPDSCPRGCKMKVIVISGQRADGSKWTGSICACVCD